jgi:ferredoxin
VTVGIEIDPELCMGSGSCVFHAPAVFDLDDDAGLASVRDPDGAPFDRIDFVARACPAGAITITRSRRS